jgi:hypothetical protein
MANPTKYHKHSAVLGGVRLHLLYAVGATGAVGTVTRSAEFRTTTPVVRVSAGVYDLFLAEAWEGLLEHNIRIRGTAVDGDGIHGRLTTDNVATVAAPKVRVTFYDEGNTAADPKSGDLVEVSLELATQPDPA